MADAAREIGSLPVANVQALAETCNNGGHVQVPQRYLTKDPGSEEVVAADDSSHAIPVIDLQKLLESQSSEEECAKLASACLNWGFFQPLDAKKECSQHAGSLEGYGQAFVVSEDQKLDWADMLYLQVHPSESRDMRFWPTRPASFGHSVDAYASETRELAYRLLELMAKAVGAEPPAVLLGVFQGQPQGMRVNYYPPCRQAADRVLGLSPHTDAGGLTLLLQMDNAAVDGLQIKKDGKWFSVNVVDGAFVVNVGDALEIMSNGKFTSVEHRAVIHPAKERISAAMFFYPCPHMMVGPLPEFVKGDKERYGSTSYEDFMKHYFATKLDGRKHLERLKLEQ
ncbi:S-norcoclaurine synthase 1 isoform X2 [Sorghum bicolor]|uniref:S-norcoclaurine synthase 1 isoform X2 n=1 Tax=Sorghum bicolor TaxID=4558 RepID=UPI000B423D61|nr:S-norcoclaurine synthase 1 isoform X2 [Sorghum bicolor]|eukprot:XP_021312272.1 S-norcoclaurine synthase 1 isoform X2 [Sorghum bicolor]